jgi:hypothetical protein
MPKKLFKKGNKAAKGRTPGIAANVAKLPQLLRKVR